MYFILVSKNTWIYTSVPIPFAQLEFLSYEHFCIVYLLDVESGTVSDTKDSWKTRCEWWWLISFLLIWHYVISRCPHWRQLGFCVSVIISHLPLAGPESKDLNHRRDADLKAQVLPGKVTTTKATSGMWHCLCHSTDFMLKSLCKFDRPKKKNSITLLICVSWSLVRQILFFLPGLQIISIPFSVGDSLFTSFDHF